MESKTIVSKPHHDLIRNSFLGVLGQPCKEVGCNLRRWPPFPASLPLVYVMVTIAVDMFPYQTMFVVQIVPECVTMPKQRVDF